jgi:hypothetical protein
LHSASSHPRLDVEGQIKLTVAEAYKADHAGVDVVKTLDVYPSNSEHRIRLMCIFNIDGNMTSGFP